MYTIFDKKYLIFELFNGKDYLEDADRGISNDQTDLAVHSFKKSKIVMSLDAFDLHKSQENQFAHHQIMRNSNQLYDDADSLKVKVKNIKDGFITGSSVYYIYFNKPVRPSILNLKNSKWVDKRIKFAAKNAAVRPPFELAQQQANNLITFSETNQINLENTLGDLRKTDLEWHHKLTTSLAILVMFLIGAPLGAIIKKGGFGIPVVVAVSFFILMYILTQQGDKMAKEGKVIVQIGAWISNGILALIGSYFMKIALQDSRLFESDFYKILFDKIKNRMFKQHTINE
jgi:lipopolysaccharide export system permease protein